MGGGVQDFAESRRDVFGAAIDADPLRQATERRREMRVLTDVYLLAFRSISAIQAAAANLRTS